MTRVALITAALLALLVTVAWGQDRPIAPPEINTILMESTFSIQGPDKNDPKTKTSFGTAFLMGKPTADKSKFYYMLVTAAHVLEGIDGENATLTLRDKHDDGSYTQRLWNVKLRDQGSPLYVKHKDADVVALYVDMPDDLNVPILPTALLADDDVLKKFGIHPGDVLRCLGFPLYVSTETGFPILRSGIIASYPIIPTKTYKSILFDFNIFEGNSSGPVYFVDHDRTYGGMVHIGETEQFVIELVTQQLSARFYDNQKLGLAAVVPSTYILETLDLLPALR